jgi:hypothetical protein
MNDLQESIFMALLPVHLSRGYSPTESAQMALSGVAEIELTIEKAFPRKVKEPKTTTQEVKA